MYVDISNRYYGVLMDKQNYYPVVFTAIMNLINSNTQWCIYMQAPLARVYSIKF